MPGVCCSLPRTQVTVALAELEAAAGRYALARRLFQDAIGQTGSTAATSVGDPRDRRTGVRATTASNPLRITPPLPHGVREPVQPSVPMSKARGTMGAIMDTAPVLLAWAALEEGHSAGCNDGPATARQLLLRAAAEHPVNLKVGLRLAQLEERLGNSTGAKALLARYCYCGPRIATTWISMVI